MRSRWPAASARLVCTATGLVVAVPAYIFHRFFRSKVGGLVVEMEKEATALLDELSAQAEPAAAAGVRAVR